MSVMQLPFFSGALYSRHTCNVYLPASYDESGDKRYPVIYLLHGLYGSEAYWLQKCAAEQTLDRMMKEGGLRESIVVFPSDGGYGHGTFYMNWYDGTGRFEDYFLYDLVPAIEAQFRTLAGPDHRALCGLSMGGYGAVVLALRHPALFGTAASLSGALFSPESVTESFLRSEVCRMFGPIRGPYALQHDPFTLSEARLQEQAAPRIYFNCGTSDYLYPVNVMFKAHLERIGYAHEYEEFSGEHNADYWTAHLPDALRFIEKSFSLSGAAKA